MSEIRLASGDRRDQLGEGVIWSARRNALFWVDILGQRLSSLNLADESIRTYDLPERISWAIERCDHDELVVGLKSGFAFFDLQDSTVAAIGNPDPDRPGNRLNDAGVDGAGRIWAGSKNDVDETPTGALYRLDPDLRWSQHDTGYTVSNGPAFSLDGQTMFHTDTLARTIFRFTIGEGGTLYDKRVHLTFDRSWGYPDGMTTDAEDGLWIAHWGGGRVSRFDPSGRLDRSISFPASQITNCAFAGANLDRMFVTSANTGITDEPLAGALFEVDAGVVGISAPPFAG